MSAVYNLPLSANSGVIYLNQGFDISKDIVVSFDYACYGTGTNGDEGFSVFFTNAAGSITGGGPGPGLCYCPISAALPSQPLTAFPGVQRGALGVGFDLTGRFSQLNSPLIPVSENLLAYWRFDDDGSGHVSLADSSSYRNNLSFPNTLSGASLGVGKVNGDIVFNGDGTTYVSAPGTFLSPDNTQQSQYSFGGWFRGTNDVFFIQTETGNNWGGGTIELNITSGDIQAGVWWGSDPGSSYDRTQVASNVLDGNWHHIFATWNQSGYLRIYQDGILVASLHASGNAANINTNNISLNSNADGTYEVGRAGEWDEITVWNCELTPDEVMALVETGPLSIRIYDGAGVNFIPQVPPPVKVPNSIAVRDSYDNNYQLLYNSGSLDNGTFPYNFSLYQQISSMQDVHTVVYNRVRVRITEFGQRLVIDFKRPKDLEFTTFIDYTIPETTWWPDTVYGCIGFATGEYVTELKIRNFSINGVFSDDPRRWSYTLSGGLVDSNFILPDSSQSKTIFLNVGETIDLYTPPTIPITRLLINEELFTLGSNEPIERIQPPPLLFLTPGTAGIKSGDPYIIIQ
jgi:hypothetical protein